MYSLLAALLAATVVFSGIAIPFKPSYAAFPAFAAFGGVYFVLARRHSKAIEALMERMQKELRGGNVDNAIRIVREGYPHTKWVFLMKAQLDGQVGTLLYMDKRFDDAEPLLQAAWSRHWLAKGMLAAHCFRKHQSDKAFKILDEALSSNKKEPMLYGLKAFLQVKLKDREAARGTLIAGREKVGENEAVASNLVRLQNGQDLQMYLFGDVWWNFHLEKPNQKALMRAAGAGAGQAKGGRKAMYRG